MQSTICSILIIIITSILVGCLVGVQGCLQQGPPPNIVDTRNTDTDDTNNLLVPLPLPETLDYYDEDNPLDGTATTDIGDMDTTSPIKSSSQPFWKFWGGSQLLKEDHDDDDHDDINNGTRSTGSSVEVLVNSTSSSWTSNWVPVYFPWIWMMRNDAKDEGESSRGEQVKVEEEEDSSKSKSESDEEVEGSEEQAYSSSFWSYFWPKSNSSEKEESSDKPLINDKVESESDSSPSFWNIIWPQGPKTPEISEESESDEPESSSSPPPPLTLPPSLEVFDLLSPTNWIKSGLGLAEPPPPPPAPLNAKTGFSRIKELITTDPNNTKKSNNTQSTTAKIISWFFGFTSGSKDQDQDSSRFSWMKWTREKLGLPEPKNQRKINDYTPTKLLKGFYGKEKVEKADDSNKGIYYYF